ncbi:helix-turn-helix domain-containing protein [Corynebacterium lowii]|uniref:Helix-turn-helix domain protein n=1 Tax=Corynebacterium lowii TaxID=1544413 RepID=A0A0Q0YY57_9CORY|nr:helix-turn-helix domain-containing protein [Corynebacterium lowii]KQB87323.1 Helix-turn-helix domain protein [Corynebacterium lowii]MDP9852089.1 excisionase family DNA binding protein [Corynebacterium lowii]
MNTTLPPTDLTGMKKLSAFLESLSEPATLISSDGETMPLPSEVSSILSMVAKSMENGKAVTVAPIDQQITTQEAADFLGISRPTLIKLLDKGELPYHRSSGGRHRKLLLQDVMDYQESTRKKRRIALDALTAEAYAAGLYDATADTYKEALHQVRREIQKDS